MSQISHPLARTGDDPVTARLLPRIAHGDRAAMETFYGLHQANLYRFALVRLGDATQAADVLHEVMLRVWRNAHRFGGDETVRVRLLLLAFEVMAEQDADLAGATVPLTEDGDTPRGPQRRAPDPRVIMAAMQATPGDFGLDRLWRELDIERRDVRARCLRRKLIRWRLRLAGWSVRRHRPRSARSAINPAVGSGPGSGSRAPAR